MFSALGHNSRREERNHKGKHSPVTSQDPVESAETGQSSKTSNLWTRGAAVGSESPDGLELAIPGCTLSP